MPGTAAEAGLPILLKDLTWVDLRGGLSTEGLDRLEWGITGKKPQRLHGRAVRRTEATDDPALAAWLRRVRSDHLALAEYFENTLLERVYVEVRLSDRAEVLELGNMRGLAEPRTLLEVLALDPAAAGHEWITGRWLLRGEPGSGKTTLLRRLAARLADQGARPWVPVFDALPKLLRDERSFADRLADRLARSPRVSQEQAAEAFERWAAERRLLLLFDGLDEVPAELRDEARDVLADLGELWPGTPLVVTTRPIGGEVLEGFHRLELLPLDNDNRRALLAGWFGRRTGMPETARAERFASELEAHRELDELIGNPPAELFQTIVTPKDGEVELWADIPEGSFLMGSPENEEDRFDDESPRHAVKISRSFKMMAVPVTNAQYQTFDQTHEGPALHPVINVSWYEATAFCRWLERNGYTGARLPTEAEWEYTCRAKTTKRFWSGDSEKDLAEVGWYAKNAGDGTHPVGEQRANPWKLYDVHGNVWEWCVDNWDSSA